jgi:predicted negative regulator of RcsB-dependent stress response
VSSYTEQHEIEQLKAWWKEYGTALIAGVLLGTALLFGVKYWRQHLEQQRVTASELYAQMMQAGQQNRTDAVHDLGARLVADYSSTPYAGAAALTLAQTLYRAGKNDEAQQQLKWAVNNASDPAVVHAARLRQARLLAAAGNNDQALLLLNVSDTGGFEAEYAELRGDILVALKRPDDAREAYRKALATPGSGAYADVLAMKLDELGLGKTP